MDEKLTSEQMVDFVLNKIEFMTPPRECDVVYGSTPVVSFGDFTKATIATIGINPSSQEFQDTSNSGTTNELLPKGKKRLADAESLGLISDDPLDDDTAEYVLGAAGAREIWEGCRDYFNGPNAYWSWFADLEKILNGLNFSYKDSSACHLDLSPWATDPVFRNLTTLQKKQLLLGESDFLEWQIARSNIKTLLFNGATVFESLKTLPTFRVDEVGEIEYMSGDKKKTSQLILGTGPGFVKVFGWTLNLQELRVSQEEKSRIIRQLILWLPDSNIDI